MPDGQLMSDDEMPQPGQQPDAMMAGPLGGGMPPEIQGQFTPEQFDMIRQANPGMFQAMMRGELPPEEALSLLAGEPR